jgi:hypothetical protein
MRGIISGGNWKTFYVTPSRSSAKQGAKMALRALPLFSECPLYNNCTHYMEPGVFAMK